MIARQITAQPMIVATTMLVNPNDASPLASEAVYAIEMLPWGGERGGLGESIVLGEGRAPRSGWRREEGGDGSCCSTSP